MATASRGTGIPQVTHGLEYMNPRAVADGLALFFAYYARQCLGFLNPALDRIDARYFVDMFLLAVNRREFSWR